MLEPLSLSIPAAWVVRCLHVPAYVGVCPNIMSPHAVLRPFNLSLGRFVASAAVTAAAAVKILESAELKDPVTCVLFMQAHSHPGLPSRGP